MNQSLIRAAIVSVLTLLVTSCGGGGSGTGTPTTTTANAGALRAACGDKVTVQTDWFPEPEHGALYQMIGPRGNLNVEKGIYSGPIGTSGVLLEIRAGGPFTGFQQVSAQMYQDRTIDLGFVFTDGAIRNSKDLPTTAIVTPLEKNPQILMWPADKYDFKSISDIGAAGTRVLYFKGVTYMDYLVGKGDLKQGQVDGGYDGSPARFVAEGDIVQQGFVTNEPYYYESTTDPYKTGFAKKVEYLLIHESGYDIYPSSIAARTEDIDGRAACWTALVPLIQQAQVDFIRAGTETNDAIADITIRLGKFWKLSKEGNADAVRKMVALNIVGNGPNSTLGDFDEARVARTIEQVKPIFAKQNKEIKPGITPADVVTNRFIDPAIRL